MTDDDLARAVEAVLLVAVEPVAPGLLAELVEEPVERVEAICDRLAASYLEQRRGFVLARVAGGFRYQSHPDLAPYVERFANRDVSHRLSTAALETLAIVAYRQPVSRAQISAVRGVNAEGVVRLLEQRGYIVAVGRAEGPGQAVLYGTTDMFLERLGLDRLEQLPPVEDFLPGADVAGELEDTLRQRQQASGDTGRVVVTGPEAAAPEAAAPEAAAPESAALDHEPEATTDYHTEPDHLTQRSEPGGG